MRGSVHLDYKAFLAAKFRRPNAFYFLLGPSGIIEGLVLKMCDIVQSEFWVLEASTAGIDEEITGSFVCAQAGFQDSLEPPKSIPKS